MLIMVIRTIGRTRTGPHSCAAQDLFWLIWQEVGHPAHLPALSCFWVAVGLETRGGFKTGDVSAIGMTLAECHRCKAERVVAALDGFHCIKGRPIPNRSCSGISACLASGSLKKVSPQTEKSP